MISRIAERYGVSTDEVRREMRKALDEARATASPEAQQRLRDLFPGGFPTEEEIIATLAGELRKQRGGE